MDIAGDPLEGRIGQRAWWLRPDDASREVGKFAEPRREVGLDEVVAIECIAELVTVGADGRGRRRTSQYKRRRGNQRTAR